MMSILAEFQITFGVALGASLATYFAVRVLFPKVATRTHGTFPLAVSRRFANIGFAVMATVYVLVFGTLSLLRHLALNSGGFDLGVFDQAIWNSLNGRLLQVSIVPDAPTLLGQRFSPILLAFVPLYAIWNDPNVLLIVQTFALALSALPVYWFAREKLGNGLALAIALAYFLCPALQYVNLYEFHEVALIAAALSFATWFLLHRQYGAMVVCLGVALLSKEEAAFTLILFGVYLFWIQRSRPLGLGLAFFGALWGIFLLQYAIPFFRDAGSGQGYYYFGNGENAGAGRYDYLGLSLSEVAVNLITHPAILIEQFLVPDKIIYTLQLLIPLSFLPIVGAEISLLALPTLGLSILSTFSPQYSINYHYAAPLIPLLFFGTVAGVQRLGRWGEWISRRWFAGEFAVVHRTGLTSASVVLLVVGSSLSYFFQAPGPGTQHFDAAIYTLDPHKLLAYSLMQVFPKDAAIITQKQLAPHLTHRQQLYEFPFVRDVLQVDYMFLDQSHYWYANFKEEWDDWLTSGYFETIQTEDGYVIAKRTALPPDEDLFYGDQIALLRVTVPSKRELRGGQTLRPILEWQATQAISKRYRIQVQLVDAQGHLWAQDDREPVDDLMPTNQWSIAKSVGDQHQLSLPSTMPTGDYQVTVAVRDQAEHNLTVHNRAGLALGDEPVVATVHIEKDQSSKTASQLRIQAPLFVDMQEIRFLGYVPPRATINAGELLQVGLYWRARAKPQGDYTVAIQLRDGAGRVAFEHTNRPANNTYPTTLWSAGEVLLDWHDFVLPDDLATGDYQIVVILRDEQLNRILGEVKIATLQVTN